MPVLVQERSSKGLKGLAVPTAEALPHPTHSSPVSASSTLESSQSRPRSEGEAAEVGG